MPKEKSSVGPDPAFSFTLTRPSMVALKAIMDGSGTAKSLGDLRLLDAVLNSIENSLSKEGDTITVSLSNRQEFEALRSCLSGVQGWILGNRVHALEIADALGIQ